MVHQMKMNSFRAQYDDIKCALTAREIGSMGHYFNPSSSNNDPHEFSPTNTLNNQEMGQ